MKERYETEVVELTRDCEIGSRGERAVVQHLHRDSMVLVFPNRPQGPNRVVRTGADYLFLREV